MKEFEMVKEIDVRGLSCPLPVLFVKKTIDMGATDITVLAEETAAIASIQRFVEQHGYRIEIETRIDGVKTLKIKK